MEAARISAIPGLQRSTPLRFVLRCARDDNLMHFQGAERPKTSTP
jgi:hypothetical protein